jgi:hypothetical protein
VSKYIVNGESTPSFSPHEKFNTTKINYERGPGEVLDSGLKEMQKLGYKTKIELAIDKNILPKFYNQRNIFVRGLSDSKTIYSAYAYMLGMYPYSINGLVVKPELMGNGETVPFKQLEDIRGHLGMRDDLCK